MSSTLSLVLLVVILAVAAILAAVVYFKVQSGQWWGSLRLDQTRDLPESSGADDSSASPPEHR